MQHSMLRYYMSLKPTIILCHSPVCCAAWRGMLCS